MNICMVEGTTSPAHNFTLEDGTGAPVVIGGGTVTLRLSGLDNAYEAAREMVILDGDTGQVQYVPIAADTAAPGLYRLDFMVTYDDGSPEVFPVSDPIWMEVRARP